MVDSTAGEGSTFRFSVATGPLDARRRVAPQTANTPHAVPQPVSSLPKGIRILLAEDGVDNQRLIRVILTKAGAEVTIAPNGHEAVEAIKKSEI